MSTGSLYLKLFGREIIFEVFQICDHGTSTLQTDRQMSGITALCVASRGKKTKTEAIMAYRYEVEPVCKKEK